MADWERELVDRMSLSDFLRTHLSESELEMLRAYYEHRGAKLARTLHISLSTFYNQIAHIQRRLRQRWEMWDKEE